MQYMLLIYTDDTTEPAPGTAEFGTYMQRYMEFTQEVKDKGLFVAGDALEKVNTATTVRVRKNEVDTTDGPFAETKEVLGGYYLLDCKDLDQAIEYAAKIPAAELGSIEIRPVMVFD
ncbi:YciI family protein [Exilibacterium tricleocarpae]|uniref:YciI family protein n=1 Tax=Exilibacterium tricleocarpae TaxID=2591008 RepID=A0A545U5H0_9GAMM|nr:YciI family protein [Exilibacterium tricleocarpae]TQV84720.1 YciI family protein [Exilibacterium tricleocarpae]